MAFLSEYVLLIQLIIRSSLQAEQIGISIMGSLIIHQAGKEARGTQAEVGAELKGKTYCILQLNQKY